MMKRKQQLTKSRIIHAAWQLFAKQGYDQTTVDEIIELSQSSKGSFYHYFKGKEALLNTLSYMFDEKYKELEQTISPDISAYDKLVLYNHELFHFIETTIDVELIAYLYGSQLTTKDNRSLLDNERVYYTVIRRTIQQGIAMGEFRSSLHVNEAARLYALYERGLIYDWALHHGAYSLSKYSDSLLPMILSQFLKPDTPKVIP